MTTAFAHQSHALPLPGGQCLSLPSPLPAKAGEGLPGSWKLAAGQALTLHARQAGLLRITHGRVWATFDHAEDPLRGRTGDHFLSRGESLPLAPGESLVVEPFGIGHASPAYFTWEASPVASLAASHGANGWRVGIVQPVLDLRAALGLAAGAAGRLARGLALGAAAALTAALSRFAMVFIASRARQDAAPCTGPAAHASAGRAAGKSGGR
ncbi:MAG: hypothetical protein JWR60_87 [Polaromonas sp.]|nr:hypothetical protein [Polaromonas sp.]